MSNVVFMHCIDPGDGYKLLVNKFHELIITKQVLRSVHCNVLDEEDKDLY